MELENDSSIQIDKQDLINNLLDQNTELRLEIAALRSVVKSEANELQLLQQMRKSQSIPPEIMEKLAKLDIR